MTCCKGLLVYYQQRQERPRTGVTIYAFYFCPLSILFFFLAFTCDVAEFCVSVDISERHGPSVYQHLPNARGSPPGMTAILGQGSRA